MDDLTPQFGIIGAPSLTLREHYAGLAMHALIGVGAKGPRVAAEEAVMTADSLIAELAKERA